MIILAFLLSHVRWFLAIWIIEARKRCIDHCRCPLFKRHRSVFLSLDTYLPGWLIKQLFFFSCFSLIINIMAYFAHITDQRNSPSLHHGGGYLTVISVFDLFYVIYICASRSVRGTHILLNSLLPFVSLRWL